ncbi:hypothetical protein A4X13_0g8011 [Tilletia indica]|uniref:Tyr recombinase domain-containing protein n=1 Tax=Tilletia indica TaxID=43049 RepID=A0A177T9H0_9BASI|nr:hypothetical protein A4X13_0g8011 [Tilletia indica]
MNATEHTPPVPSPFPWPSAGTLPAAVAPTAQRQRLLLRSPSLPRRRPPSPTLLPPPSSLSPRPRLSHPAGSLTPIPPVSVGALPPLPISFSSGPPPPRTGSLLRPPSLPGSSTTHQALASTVSATRLSSVSAGSAPPVNPLSSVLPARSRPETRLTRATAALTGADVWTSLNETNVPTAVLTARGAQNVADKKETALLLTPAAHLLVGAHGSSDLAAARAHSQLYWTSVKPKTRLKYAYGIKSYLVWCDEVGLPMHLRFPVGENILVLYLQKDMAELRAGTVKARQSALMYWHRVQRMPWALEQADAKALQRAVKVVCLPPLEKRRPVRLNDLSAMASGCDRSRPAEIAVLAAAFFAFWALCRPGEVTVRSESTPEDDRARWSDWSLRAPRTPEGVTSFLLRLPSDKTHGSAGFDRIVAEQQHIPSLCPVSAVRQHMQTNTLRVDEDTTLTGAFSYRTADGGRRELTESFFGDTVNRWLLAAGRPRVTGHCFRIGGATLFFCAGKPLADIKLRGGWESESYLVYIRDNFVRHAEMFGNVDPAGLFYD